MTLCFQRLISVFDQQTFAYMRGKVSKQHIEETSEQAALLHSLAVECHNDSAIGWKNILPVLDSYTAGEHSIELELAEALMETAETFSYKQVTVFVTC